MRLLDYSAWAPDTFITMCQDWSSRPLHAWLTHPHSLPSHRPQAPMLPVFCPTAAYAEMASDFDAGMGEIAAALLRVCKYALARFGIGDILFGIYHLSKAHVDSQAGEAESNEPSYPPVADDGASYHELHFQAQS